MSTSTPPAAGGTRIVIVSGSLRKASFNTHLARAAAQLAPAGAQVEVATLHGIPLYDGDLEADSGLPENLEDTCSTDADCELCTGPLGIGDPCCPGCPLISSKEICAQIRAAMDACEPGRLPLCPQVACLFPGSPKCSPEGKCTMTPGIEQ